MTAEREGVAERWVADESPCLRYGWGLCPKCRAGFPQWCQCKPQPKRTRHVAPPSPAKEG